MLSETTPSGLSNIEYWSWKSKNRKDVQEISQEEEYIEELPESLQSTTGSFKSEGVRKIPEIEKIGYLPHRKRTNKPIKTIQYEDEDEEKPNENTNAVQSSRVNRANNRRFAADITAQIGSESDVLSLNALTKRKTGHFCQICYSQLGVICNGTNSCKRNDYRIRWRTYQTTSCRT